VQHFLQQEVVQTILWPAMSPDMNSIEHVWNFIGLMEVFNIALKCSLQILRTFKCIYCAYVYGIKINKEYIHRVYCEVGVTVWGCFSFACKLDLCVLDGNLTGQKYRDNVLAPRITPISTIMRWLTGLL
jgi:hypothetical protein